MSIARAALAVVLGASLSSALVACGNGGVATGRPKIAFVIADDELNFASEMAAGFTAAANGAGGVDVTVIGPHTVDGPREVTMFQDQAAKAKGGISVETISPELFARPLAAAAKDGIPLIAVDTAPAPGAGVKLYVGNDNYELGTQLAAEAIKRLPATASGTVILGTTAPGVLPLDLRAQGMRDEFKKQLPQVRVQGTFNTSQEVAGNLAAWRRLVEANPDAIAFLGTGDADAYSLAAIHRQTRATWLGGAFDLDPKSLQGVKDGDLFAVMSPEHYLKGAIAGRLQAEHAKAETDLPEGWIYTPGLVVTRGNIEQIVRRQASAAAKSTWFAPGIAKILGGLKSSIRPLADAR
ncbi:MAG: ribose transport system substrate-binding protein [Cryptosporangiaceae bacterium]|nr:ribose transport system substrate-binding protein [Cryptosporangiaceae bacterium]